MVNEAELSCEFPSPWRCRFIASTACEVRMTGMLTLQKRHSKKCRDRNKGPNFLKCRGHCPLRVCGTSEGRRVRISLKTRDLQRAARRLTEIEDRISGRPRKTVVDA